MQQAGNTRVQGSVKRDHLQPLMPGADERFRLLVESVKDYAIFLIDANGYISTWNTGAECINGYQADEIIGKHFSIFYPKEVIEKDWAEHELEVARKQGGFEDDEWLIRKDGSRFWANVIITTMRNKDGEIICFSKIIRDLTERKRDEEQMKALAERLQRSNSELEQFASVAAHDLQEPLRKIEAFGDRLRLKCDEQLGEQGKDYLNRMQASAVRMRRLINDILAFSRLTTKAQPFEPVDLTQLVQEVVSDLEESIQQSGGQVNVETLTTVEADALQMRQLLQNLIANALKFHKPDEPPVVRVAGRMIDGTSSIPLCEITVEDKGIGFDEQYQDRIFQIFQRLHGRQEYEGTGVGLAICRKIAERHGGTITARSYPGNGAIFTVTLPTKPLNEGGNFEETKQTHHDLDGR